MPERFQIRMYEWHLPTKSGKCQVCLAGSLLAITGKLPDNYGVNFDEMADPLRKKMTALNDLRRGRIVFAAAELGITLDPLKDKQLIDYHLIDYPLRGDQHYRGDAEDPAKDLHQYTIWRQSMTTILQLLEQHGY